MDSYLRLQYGLLCNLDAEADMKASLLVVLGLATVLRSLVCWAASPQGTPPIDVTQTMFSGTVVKNDAVWGLGTCSVTGGSFTVTCSPVPASFPSPATGYTVLLVADDAGTTGGGTSITVSGTSAVLPIDVQYPLWVLLRSGIQPANFSDTLDCTTNILSKLPSVMANGPAFHMRLCNQTVGIGSPPTLSPVETIVAADASTTISGTATINQGTCGAFTITRTGTSTIAITRG